MAPVADPLDAVPVDASVIIDTKNPRATWQKLSKSSELWQQLINISEITAINRAINYADSLIKKNPEVSEILVKQRLVTSLHVIEKNKVAFLFLIGLPDNGKADLIHDLIENSLKNKEDLKKLKSSKNEYYQLNVDKNTSFFYTISKGVFVSSFDKLLFDKSLNQLNSGKSLKADGVFSKITSTAGKNVDANIYVNYREFSKVIGKYLNTQALQSTSFLFDFQCWSELDFSIRPEYLILNGFSCLETANDNFMKLFKNQQPTEIEITRLIPSNAAAFLTFGFSNYNSFFCDYKKYSSKNKKSLLDSINSNYSFNLENYFVPWIGNEMAISVKETFSPSTTENAIAIIEAKDIDLAHFYLSHLSDTLLLIEGEKKIKLNKYRGYDEYKLNSYKLLPAMFGNVFSPITNPYFIYVDKFIVFANSTSILEDYIDDYTEDRVIAKNMNYVSFCENIAGKANVYLYCNFARSSNLLKSYASNNFSEILEYNNKYIRKINAIAIQLSSQNDMLYSNIVVSSSKRNTVRDAKSSLWETTLEAPVAVGPALINIKSSGEKNIFVQDELNFIYLLNGKGEIIFKQKLEERICGNPNYVDEAKSKKYILIAGKKKLYKLDLKGNRAEGFPISFKADATCEITFADIGNSGTYRIFVACADKKIYNYSLNGSLTKGWSNFETKEFVYKPLQYFRIDGKDILVSIEKSGKISFLDRKGNLQQSIKDNIATSRNNGLTLNKIKNKNAKFQFCTTDSAGKIYFISLKGTIESEKIKTLSPFHYFDYSDINSDKENEYIFIDGTNLSIYNQKKNLITSYTFPDNVTGKPLLYNFSESKQKIGVVSSRTNELFLFNSDGSVYEGFPMHGSRPFVITDLNGDGKKELISAGADKSIFAVSIK